MMKFLKVLATFLLLTVITFFIVNSFDEELDPEITELVAPRPFDITNRNNAFLYMLGMHAEKNTDPYMHGLAVYDDIANRDFADLADYDSGPVKFQMEKFVLCTPTGKNLCLEKYTGSRQKYNHALATNTLPLQRYSSLLEYENYIEPSSTDHFLLHNDLITANKTLLASAGLDWIDGRKHQSVEKITRSYRFWMKVSESDPLLITKMIAFANLRQDLQLLSEFITDCANCINTSPNINLVAQQFSAKTMSIRKTMEHEFRFQYRHLSTKEKLHMGKEDTLTSHITNTLAKTIFQRNSTLNKFYAYQKKYFSKTDRLPEDYRGVYQSLKSLEDEATDIFNFSDLFIDPFGNILLAVSTISYERYIFAAYEIENIRRLVNLKLAIKTGKLPGNDIPAMLENSPGELNNILTGDKAHYNQLIKTLEFTYMTDKKQTISISMN